MDLSRQNYDNGTPENRKLSNNDTATNWRGYADELRYENRQFALGHTSQVDLGVWESSVMYNVSETIGRTIPRIQIVRVVSLVRMLKISVN
ncbi:hypothetical protein ACT691_12820 [Vibrio metschnikovii]